MDSYNISNIDTSNQMAKIVDYLKSWTAITAVIVAILGFYGVLTDNEVAQVVIIVVSVGFSISSVGMYVGYSKQQKENTKIYIENNHQREVIIQQNDKLLSVQKENLAAQYSYLKELNAVNEEIVSYIRQNADIKDFFQKAVNMMHEHRKEINQQYEKLDKKFDTLESNVNSSIKIIADRVKKIEDKLN
jgi:hypothetical protein